MVFFKGSQMKSKFKKSSLLVSINESLTINIGPEEIANSRTKRILGLAFDRKPEFETRMKQASNKIHTLIRITPLMSVSKRKSRFETRYVRFEYFGRQSLIYISQIIQEQVPRYI